MLRVISPWKIDLNASCNFSLENWSDNTKNAVTFNLSSFQPKGSSLTPDDTGWVGAWWLGYLIGAALCLLPVIPMLGFPREFPDTDAVRQKKRELEDSVKVITVIKLLCMYGFYSRVKNIPWTTWATEANDDFWHVSLPVHSHGEETISL